MQSFPCHCLHLVRMCRVKSEILVFCDLLIMTVPAFVTRH